MLIRTKVLVLMSFSLLANLGFSAPRAEHVVESESSDTKTHVADRIVGPEPTSNRLWISEFDTTTAAALSGPWYDADQSGHGFFFTFDRNSVTVSWFTFRDGDPLWLVGSFNGFHDQYLDFDLALYEASGASFPPQFDPDDVSQEFWGQLYVDVRSCSEIRVEWDPVGVEETPGSMTLRRITPQRGRWCYIHDEVKSQSISVEMCREKGGGFDIPRDGEVLWIDEDEVIEVRGNLWGPDDVDYYYIVPPNPALAPEGYVDGVDKLHFDFQNVAEIDEDVEVSVISRHSHIITDRSCEIQKWDFSQTLPIEVYGDSAMPNAQHTIQLPTLEEQAPYWASDDRAIVALRGSSNDGGVDYSFTVQGFGPGDDGDPPSGGVGPVGECVAFTADPSAAYAGYFSTTCAGLDYPINVGFCYTGDFQGWKCSESNINDEPGWWGAAQVSGPNAKRYVSGPTVGGADDYEVYFGACEDGYYPRIDGSLINGRPESYFCGD